MDTMWAPWRMEYIGGDFKPKDECVFCLPANHNGPDKDRLVLFSDETLLVIMNRFPYNNGHLMVAPRRHVATLALAEPKERAALTDMAARLTEILTKEMRPDGFNMGINQGLPAGAGIADHLHFHVTPRYMGDTNYMTTLAACRVIPEHLLKTFDKLVAYF